LRRKSDDGLTLMELILALAIIGVLAVIAYPSYQNNLHKDRAALAKSFLLQISSQQQMYVYQHDTYAHDLSLLGVSPSETLASYYDVIIEIDQDAKHINFLVRAEPKFSANHSNFEVLTINHLGQTSDNWNN